MSQATITEKRKRNLVPLPRRKACNSCSLAKVRCDHKPSCSRCLARDIACVYPALKRRCGQAGVGREDIEASQDSTHTAAAPGLRTPSGDEAGALPNNSTVRPTLLDTTIEAFVPAQISDLLSSDGLEGIVCNIDASAIQTRWLDAFLPEPHQQRKVPPANVNTYVLRVLKSYGGDVVHQGTLPPFIHERSLIYASVESPLRTCMSLSKLCSEGHSPSAVRLVEAEMAGMFEKRSSLGGTGLLCVFQAYLVYVLLLYFHLALHDFATLRQHMMNLQQLAFETCSRGTITTAELNSSRPQWPSWIHVEEKRRTLFIMYLLDNLLCDKDNIPVYIATELRGLPAPSGKHQWRAQTEEIWRAAYNSRLAQWNDSGLLLEELWSAPDLSPTEAQHRSDRIDRWLEGADEYCTMFYAVTSATHGV